MIRWAIGIGIGTYGLPFKCGLPGTLNPYNGEVITLINGGKENIKEYNWGENVCNNHHITWYFFVSDHVSGKMFAFQLFKNLWESLCFRNDFLGIFTGRTYH